MYKTFGIILMVIICGNCSQAQVTAKATISANIVTPVGVEVETEIKSDGKVAGLNILSNESYFVTEEEIYYSRKQSRMVKSITINFE